MVLEEMMDGNKTPNEKKCKNTIRAWYGTIGGIVNISELMYATERLYPDGQMFEDIDSGNFYYSIGEADVIRGTFHVYVAASVNPPDDPHWKELAYCFIYDPLRDLFAKKYES